MTLEVISYNTTYTWVQNRDSGSPNPVTAATLELEVWSQLSNTLLFSVPLTLVTSNDRYAEYTFTLPALEGDNHYNGMYNYMLYQDSGLVDQGSLKLIFSPGGGTGTQDYISNNENRQAVVYYDPAY
jgi:hypothetical protein